MGSGRRPPSLRFPKACPPGTQGGRESWPRPPSSRFHSSYLTRRFCRVQVIEGELSYVIVRFGLARSSVHCRMAKLLQAPRAPGTMTLTRPERIHRTSNNKDADTHQEHAYSISNSLSLFLHPRAPSAQRGNSTHQHDAQKTKDRLEGRGGRRGRERKEKNEEMWTSLSLSVSPGYT